MNEIKEGYDLQKGEVKLPDACIEQGVEDVERLRGEIARAVGEELSKNAVKMWVRHELEEVIGNIVLRNTQMIVERITSSVDKKLKYESIDLKEARVQVLERTAQKIVGDLGDTLKKASLEEDLREKCRSILQRKVYSIVEDTVTRAAKKKIEILEPSIMPELREKTNKMMREEIGRLVVNEISTLLAQVQELQRKYGELQDKVNELEWRRR